MVAICAALIAPAFAAAQTVDPTTDQYNPTLQQVSEGGSACVEDGSGNNCAPPPASNNGLGGNVGPLPFTGFDVLAMAAVALAVTGLGLGLQRAVSRDADELA